MLIQITLLEMKHQANKILFFKGGRFFIIGILFISCQRSNQLDTGPLVVTSQFLKSFITADTVLFYSTIERDSVVNYAHKEIFSKNENIYDVRRILFFKYAYLKTSEDRRQELIKDPFPFARLEFKDVRKDGGNIKTIIVWQGKYDITQQSLIVTLFDKGNGNWKIKKIDL